MNPYESPTFDVVAAQDETTRVSFVRKTYWHLAGAVAAFALIEYMLLNAGLENSVFSLLGASKYSWLMVMGAFMGVSWIAEKWANSSTSLGMQYFGLSVYVVAQALIMLPLLMIANGMENGVIAKAGMVTVAMVLGLTGLTQAPARAGADTKSGTAGLPPETVSTS